VRLLTSAPSCTALQPLFVQARLRRFLPILCA